MQRLKENYVAFKRCIFIVTEFLLYEAVLIAHSKKIARHSMNNRGAIFFVTGELEITKNITI